MSKRSRSSFEHRLLSMQRSPIETGLRHIESNHPAVDGFTDVSGLPEFDAKMYASQLGQFVSDNDPHAIEDEFIKRAELNARRQSVMRTTRRSEFRAPSFWDKQEREIKRQSDRFAKFKIEKTRLMMQAPVISAKEELKDIVHTSAPSSPVYSLAFDRWQDVVGVVFGECSVDTIDLNTGDSSHNDINPVTQKKAVAAPWIVQRTATSNGFVPAGYSPTAVDTDYSEELGIEMFRRGLPLVVASIGAGSLTLIRNELNVLGQNQVVSEVHLDTYGLYTRYSSPMEDN